MVRQRAKAHKQVEDTSWIPVAMEQLRTYVAANGVEITARTFASVMTQTSLEVAEQRLRKLTQLGWLYMTTKRDAEGKFVEFIWELR